MASVEALRAALERLVRKLLIPNANSADIDASTTQIASLGREVTSAIESEFTAAKEPDLPNSA